MRDSLRDDRSFRTLNIIDDNNREGLWIEINTFLPAVRVEWILDQIAAERGGHPKQLCCNNGPDFIAQTLDRWSKRHQVNLDFLQPGKPAQNGFVERFSRTDREEVLDLYLFELIQVAVRVNT